MADRIYLKCSAKEKQSKYGPKLVIGVKASDLIAFAEQHANDRGYVNLVVQARKEVGQYGDTHSVLLDDYQPAAKANTDSVPF
jgi:hypothetical protein